MPNRTVASILSSIKHRYRCEYPQGKALKQNSASSQRQLGHRLLALRVGMEIRRTFPYRSVASGCRSCRALQSSI